MRTRKIGIQSRTSSNSGMISKGIKYIQLETGKWNKERKKRKMFETIRVRIYNDLSGVVKLDWRKKINPEFNSQKIILQMRRRNEGLTNKIWRISLTVDMPCKKHLQELFRENENDETQKFGINIGNVIEEINKS